MTELDPVIHAQARLRVVTTLATLPSGDQMSFTRLQGLLDMTPGNLVVHLRKLDEAGYTSRQKVRVGSGNTTYVGLTARGRAAFEEYIATLRALLDPVTSQQPGDSTVDTDGAGQSTLN